MVPRENPACRRVVSPEYLHPGQWPYLGSSVLPRDLAMLALPGVLAQRLGWSVFLYSSSSSPGDWQCCVGRWSQILHGQQISPKRSRSKEPEETPIPPNSRGSALFPEQPTAAKRASSSVHWQIFEMLLATEVPWSTSFQHCSLLAVLDWMAKGSISVLVLSQTGWY